MKKKILSACIVIGGAAAISAASVANIEPYDPIPHGLDRKKAPIEDFCERHWGTLSADMAVCRFEQTHFFHLSAVGDAQISSGIPVLSGDMIRFEATDGAVPIVGKVRYDGVDDEFVAGSEGYLAFRAPGGSRLVMLKKVRQFRCYEQNGSSVKAVSCKD